MQLTRNINESGAACWGLLGPRASGWGTGFVNVQPDFKSWSVIFDARITSTASTGRNEPHQRECAAERRREERRNPCLLRGPERNSVAIWPPDLGCARMRDDGMIVYFSQPPRASNKSQLTHRFAVLLHETRIDSSTTIRYMFDRVIATGPC